ncbi:ABC transporter ATP-binding protein [Streptomyces sp. TLI_171]|uniref:ABC transporter ATP-binding protein n=1 Tax=Streptomyces sp. TLI_171 TaxID=1938859 RepID=UPI000C19B59E|nr:ABC transporter ATP-binding protein [Streptomyces sp. TLI_171]RKE17445.1 ATP-binding cassette subfamily B protein [Streptomyces sp. TLI_171]
MKPRRRTADAARPVNPARAGDRLLSAAVRRAPGWTAALAAASLTAAACTLALPAAAAAAVDAALRGTAPLTAVATLAVLLLLVAAADMLAAAAGPAATAAATAQLRRRLTAHILAVGPAAVRAFPAGDLNSRLVGATARAASAGPALVGAAAAAATSLGGLVALAVLDWRPALAFLLTAAPAVLVMRRFLAGSSELSLAYQRAVGRIAARLAEAMRGVRTIRAAGTADREAERVLAPLPELAAAGGNLWLAQAGAVWRMGLLLPLVEVAVLGTAGLGVEAGRLTSGQLLAAAGYAALGTALFNQADALMGLAAARAGARRLVDVLDLPIPPAGTREPVDGPGELELRAVTVRVDGRTVLDGVRLTVPAGALLAVVGRSGSGRSTLAELAARLRDPDEGAVLLDGLPLAELREDALRTTVACAFARPGLPGGTLAEAIAYGRPDAGEQAVRDAARAAEIAGFVDRLPAGYRTPVAEAPMSGGEAQRLGLARAVAQDAKVLVLDDALSSLDSATAAKIETVLTDTLADRTRLLITHRAATAARADLVAWLDAGRLRATGRHADLWAAHPDYRAVFDTDLPPDGSSASASDRASEGFPCPVR